MPAVLRPAEPADADALGLVHVRAWQAAYRGVMPDEYLDALRAADRADMWREALAGAPRPDRRRTVVEKDGVVVGFAVCGPENTGTEPAHVGELYAINLDPDVWGQGLGRALLASVVSELRDLGYTEAVLWVVPENARARRVYEADGWWADGASQRADALGATVDEVRYRRRL